MTRIRMAAGWAVLALIALFIVLNLQLTSVGMLGLELRLPLSLIIIVAAAFGSVARPVFRRVILWVRGAERRRASTLT